MAKTFVTKLQQASQTIDLKSLHNWLTHELPDHCDSLKGLVVGPDEANNLKCRGQENKLLSLVVCQCEEYFFNYDVQDVFLQLRRVASDELENSDDSSKAKVFAHILEHRCELEEFVLVGEGEPLR